MICATEPSAALTEQRVRYEEASRSYADQAADRIERNCGADLSTALLRDCVRQEIEAAEDSKRAERDLDAQEVMARFTRVMGYTGLIGLVLGFGSVYLIWATLRETQRMAGDTRDIGEAQVRAYLRCANVVCKPLGKNATDDVFTLRVETENLGQSPASNIQIIVGIDLMNFDGTRAGTPIQLNAPASESMAPRGAATAMLSFGYGHGAADAVRESKAYLRFTVAYVYDDVFGKRTEFITYHHTEGSLLDDGITAAHIVTMKPDHKPK